MIYDERLSWNATPKSLRLKMFKLINVSPIPRTINSSWNDVPEWIQKKLIRQGIKE